MAKNIHLQMRNFDMQKLLPFELSGLANMNNL